METLDSQMNIYTVHACLCEQWEQAGVPVTQGLP